MLLRYLCTTHIPLDLQLFSKMWSISDDFWVIMHTVIISWQTVKQRVLICWIT